MTCFVTPAVVENETLHTGALVGVDHPGSLHPGHPDLIRDIGQEIPVAGR